MCLVLPHGVLHSGYAPQGLGASIAILRHGSPRLPRGRVQWATHTGGLDASLSFDEVWGLGSSKRGPARCCRLRGFTLGYRPLCKDIDGNYDADQGAALHQVNLALPPADHFPVPAPHPPRQQELAAPGPGREAYRAHFQLLQQEGAGAWLHAFPNDALGLHVVTPLFRTMVRLRLRLPIADSDMACPLCDGTSDSFGDHARVCPCGGDRVKRHNQLRNILAGRARAAGLQPEVEKPNLLPPRPELQGGTEDGSQPRGNGRRPADVWIANWNLHGPAAFDVAVTSGLRQGHLAASAADGSKASMDYEVRKCHHLDTLQACATEGLQFISLVVEACGGGWGPTALKRGGPSRPLSLPGQVKAAPWNCSACCRPSALRCTGRMPGP